MRVDWCVSSWFRIMYQEYSLTLTHMDMECEYSSCHPKLPLPFLPAGVGRARGRRVCGMSVGPRSYAMSALRLFHNIEG